MSIKDYYNKVASHHEEITVYHKTRNYPLADFYVQEDKKSMTLVPAADADIHNLVERAIAYAKDNDGYTVRVAQGDRLYDISKDKSLEDNVTAIAGYPVTRAVWTPPPTMDMTVAAEDGDLARVKELVALGHDVNAKNDQGWPPLNRAAYKGRLDVIEYLLDNKADINGQETIGYTALHLAALGGEMAAAKLLLERGADTRVLSRTGDTAYARDCSETNRHHDITKLIDSWPEVLEQRRLAAEEQRQSDFAADIERHTVLQEKLPVSRVLRLKV